MSILRPLRATRYATAATRDLSTRLSPPYDVLDAAGKQALLQADARNFVQVDLPHAPAKAAGPPQVYAQARLQFERWLGDGTLVRDPQPAFYVYQQGFRHEGVAHVRRMFFARLRLEPFGRGSVFPHEQTFGGPKEDRLCLMRATRANLSPIFALYEDAENAVARRLEQGCGADPLAVGTLEGVENRIWAVTDAATIEEVSRLMRPKATYIADGHHRYGTALLYREWLSESELEGPLPGEHPAHYVLCVCCALEDPGLLILPTHRVLPGVAISTRWLQSDRQLDVAPLPVSDPQQAPQALGSFGPQALALFSGLHKPMVVRPREASLLDDIAPERSLAWRRLGLAFLHAYLLERKVVPELCGGKGPEVRYIQSAQQAVEQAKQTRGAAFVMQPTTIQELRAVCQAGDLMPQKSTYFYPKLASGLVINPLTD